MYNINMIYIYIHTHFYKKQYFLTLYVTLSSLSNLTRLSKE